MDVIDLYCTYLTTESTKKRNRTPRFFSKQALSRITSNCTSEATDTLRQHSQLVYYMVLPYKVLL